MRYLSIVLAASLLATSAAFDETDTVYIAASHPSQGKVVRINASDYRTEIHGPRLNENGDPEGSPVAPAPSLAAGVVPPAPLPTGGAPAAAGTSAPPPPPPAPPSGYADPVIVDGKVFVAQIGERWFVTDAQSRKYQKGQSAAGYGSQEEANAAVAKVIAAAAT